MQGGVRRRIDDMWDFEVAVKADSKRGVMLVFKADRGGSVVEVPVSLCGAVLGAWVSLGACVASLVDELVVWACKTEEDVKVSGCQARIVYLFCFFALFNAGLVRRRTRYCLLRMTVSPGPWSSRSS